jgi:N-acetylated-alpha-linked acidic dipeptidase
LPDIEARHAKAIETLNSKIVTMNQQLGGAASSLGGGKN